MPRHDGTVTIRFGHSVEDFRREIGRLADVPAAAVQRMADEVAEQLNDRRIQVDAEVAKLSLPEGKAFIGLDMGAGPSRTAVIVGELKDGQLHFESGWSCDIEVTCEL